MYNLDNIKKRTLEHVQELRELNDFMNSDEFYKLTREVKDLYYEQNIQLTKLVLADGKLCELLGIKLFD